MSANNFHGREMGGAGSSRWGEGAGKEIRMGVVQEAKPRNRMTKRFVCFHVTDGKTQIITPNFMIKLKKLVVKHLFYYFIKLLKLESTLSFF
jgi:hypothetical protein